MKTRLIRTLSLILTLFIFCPVLVAESEGAKKSTEQVEKKSTKKKSSKKSSKKKSSKKSSKKKSKKKSKAKSAVAVEAESYMLPSAELTLGFMTGDLETEGIGDLLIPLWNPGGKGLLFVNPRGATTDHDAEEVNIGVGYRQLLPKQNIIVGANVYYDYRDTGYSNYDQWGVGIEMLSTWVDARANYYDPSNKKMVVGSETETSTQQSVKESAGWTDPYALDHYILQDYTTTRSVTTTTSTRTYEQYEQALGGYDWEIGLRLPLPIRPETLEARIFGGMYDFDRDFGDDADGWKARAELRILASLFLDGGVYENDDLTGSDWFAGARLTVPLDLTKVSQGRNPFSTAQGRLHGKTRTLQSRLTEMVMRDPQIRLEQSKFLENKALATSESTSTSTSTRQEVVMKADVEFVDGDAPVSGNGTAENPFTAIQTGVDNAFGGRNVYVFDAAAAYEENVLLTSGINLFGSGSILHFQGGRSFGSGIAPIVDGMSRGPAITMANDTLVRGFSVRNTDRGGPPIMINVASRGPMDVSRVGILGNNVTDLTLTDNTLSGNSYGALLTRLGGEFNMTFRGGLVQNNDRDGMLITGVGTGSGTFNALIKDSVFSDNGTFGLDILSAGYDDSLIQVRDSQLNNNGAFGLNTVQDITDLAMAVVSGVQANDNLGFGINITQMNNDIGLANISGSSANGNAATGIQLIQNSDYVSVGLIGLPSGTGSSASALLAGLGMALPDELASLFSASGGVSASNNGGMGIMSMQTANHFLSLGAFFDIKANNNGSDGIMAQVMNADGFAVALGGSSETWSDILQVGDGVAGLLGINLPVSIAGGGHMQTSGNTGSGLILLSQGTMASITALAGIEANNNGALGIMNNNSSDSVSITLLDRIAADNNSGTGIMTTTTGDDAAIQVLADMKATQNGGSGIHSDVISANGIAALLTLSTDVLRPIAADPAGILGPVGALVGNMFFGAPIVIPDAPFSFPGTRFGPMVTSGNAANGFEATVVGDDFALGALMDLQANGNGGNGIDLNVHSANGMSISALLSSELLYDILPGNQYRPDRNQHL